MSFETLNPKAIQEGVKAKGTKAKNYGSYGSSDFADIMLGAAGAMGPAATTAGSMYGSPNSAAVLAAAFSGINATAAHKSGYGVYGGASYGGTPYFAGGFGNYASTGGTIGTLDPNSSVIPGTEGFSQMDMINTMNQNNLQLLELQAVMQSNMQGWNTKSNILSADHRARMAMIEKFTARG